jgi:dihydrofolate reductase
VARLIAWNLMTLDGFMEGPGHDLSWHMDVWGEELERLSIEQLKAAGALMFGRVTHDLMANYWSNETGDEAEVANFMNRLPKYVFSRTLPSSAWTNTRVFGSDLAGTVAGLKRETAKDIFIFGSAALCGELIPLGLIDEVRIGICPVLLGSGTPLFKPAAARVKLKLTDSRPLSTGIVINRYVPQA